MTCTDSSLSAPRPLARVNNLKKEEKWRLPVVCTSFAHRLVLQDWCPWPTWWTFSSLWRWWWPPPWSVPWYLPDKCEDTEMRKRLNEREMNTEEMQWDKWEKKIQIKIQYTLNKNRNATSFGGYWTTCSYILQYLASSSTIFIFGKWFKLLNKCFAS